MNEVVVPLALKDRFNASQPVDDAQFAPKVLTFGQEHLDQELKDNNGLPIAA